MKKEVYELMLINKIYTDGDFRYDHSFQPDSIFLCQNREDIYKKLENIMQSLSDETKVHSTHGLKPDIIKYAKKWLKHNNINHWDLPFADFGNSSLEFSMVKVECVSETSLLTINKRK